MTFFVVCYPLAPLLALMNNVLELIVDTDKIMSRRRPVPVGSSGIGYWVVVFSAFTNVSTITNIYLYCFATDQIKNHFGAFIQANPNLFFNPYSDLRPTRELEIQEKMAEIITADGKLFNAKITEYRVWMFILITCVFWSLQNCVLSFLPDEPHEVTKFLARQEAISTALPADYISVKGKNVAEDWVDSRAPVTPMPKGKMQISVNSPRTITEL